MKLNTPYLPSEGKYKPTTVAGATSYGYPWQYNPIYHKVTSDPFFCSKRYVLRRYADNRVVYTRTTEQVQKGLYTYYLYDQDAHVIETGEVALPVNITDDNWYLYKYKTNAEQTAFIRSLNGRTHVMTATYQPTHIVGDGTRVNHYPVATISCYHSSIEADTLLNNDGAYQVQDGYTYYSFTHHAPDNVVVSITERVNSEPQSPDMPDMVQEPVDIIAIKQPYIPHPGYQYSQYTTVDTGSTKSTHCYYNPLSQPVSGSHIIDIRQLSAYIHAPPRSGILAYPRPPTRML